MLSPEIPFITEKEDSKPSNISVKPLFKLKICDVHRLEYNDGEDSYKLEDYTVSYISCGGKISDIFRDDDIFSFLLDDGTGTIECFHKSKNTDLWLAKLQERRPIKLLLSTTLCSNITTTTNETTFSNGEIDPVLKEFEKETNERIEKIVSWFKDKVVYEQKPADVGKCIHITGFICEGEDSSRKINVLDYRIVEDEDDYEDFQMEIDYLRNCIYNCCHS